MCIRDSYYARVSSKDQNLDRQLAAFKALGADERDIITDKESGKDFNRAGYQALKNGMLRQGDTLVIKSLDRLSRNKRDIKTELEWFKDNNIRLKVIDLPTTCLLYTSPSPRDGLLSRMPSSAWKKNKHISQPTRRTPISYAAICLKKKKKTQD